MSYRVMINTDADWPNPGDMVIIRSSTTRERITDDAMIPCYDTPNAIVPTFMESNKHVGFVLRDVAAGTRLVPVFVNEKTMWIHAKFLQIVVTEDDHE